MAPAHRFAHDRGPHKAARAGDQDFHANFFMQRFGFSQAWLL
jgi:hypothetical protein